jgi:hypothetical protein
LGLTLNENGFWFPYSIYLEKIKDD